MLDIKKKEELEFEDVNNYICLQHNKNYIFVNEKSALDNAILLSKKIAKNVYRYSDFNHLFQKTVIEKFDSVNKILSMWLTDNAGPNYMSYFDISKSDEQFFFIKEILLISIYYRIYSYLHGLDITHIEINNCLKLINFNDYIYQCSDIWDIDDGSNSIDITFENHKFLVKDAEFDNKDILFIRKVLISMLDEHINNNPVLFVKHQTPINIKDCYFIFKSSSFLGICFSELINNIVYSDIYSGIKKCKNCHKQFLKESNNQKYCSTKCSEEAKKESDKKYNSSAKGIKRTIKFNLGKEKRNTN